MRRPAIDRDVFADHRAIADLGGGFFSAVLEVLRSTADDAANAHLHAAAERDVALQSRARSDHTIVADDAILTYHRESADLHPFSELGVGRDNRTRMDARRCHLSRTIAAMSASATTSPSTLPTPRILQTLPRSWTISSSNLI